MPKLKNLVPKYRLHKASGQAVVTIQGKDHYLGLWNSKASKAEYNRITGEWLVSGRSTRALTRETDLTIVELCQAYWRFAEQYYGSTGKRRGTANNLKPILRLLRQNYGRTKVADFGPLALKSIRSKLIEKGQSRAYINVNICCIRRIFKWAVSEELIPVEVFQRLATVEGLKKGRTKACETSPVMPVADAAVEKTLPYLSTIIADMVRLQRFTACRPGEICMIRPCDVDTSEEVWAYRPKSHKTEHHGHQRVIFIGPKGQEVLRKYLLRDKETYCFSPEESEQKRRAQVHEQRKTPMACGNRPGSNRKRHPSCSAGNNYTNDSYRQAIHRACDAAFPAPDPQTRHKGENKRQWINRLTEKEREELKAWQSEHHWSPNQLRHSAATEIRKRYGLEGSQVVLSHANADVTQMYAERDLDKAAAIMKEVG